MIRRLLLIAVIGQLSLVTCGCEHRAATREVVLYTSVDQPIAAPIINTFEKQTGIHVVLVTDAEATKSVGLAERVRAEAKNPQCDVFWSNEPFHTINLARDGLLQSYDSPSSGDVPARFKDPQQRWTGNALRARVIAVKAPAVMPRNLQDLTNAAFKGKLAMARPTAGTTGGHVAALYLLWGEQKADDYFRGLRANDIKLLGGNSIVAESVANQTVDAGLTDNDDAAAANANIAHVMTILPDQDSMGTLLIPTTVGLVKGAPHPAAAKQLIDYLVSSDVENRLIDVQFARWPVRGARDVREMEIDYTEAAKLMPQAVRRAIGILEGRE